MTDNIAEQRPVILYTIDRRGTRVITGVYQAKRRYIWGFKLATECLIEFHHHHQVIFQTSTKGAFLQNYWLETSVKKKIFIYIFFCSGAAKIMQSAIKKNLQKMHKTTEGKFFLPKKTPPALLISPLDRVFFLGGGGDSSFCTPQPLWLGGGKVGGSSLL